MAVPHKGLCRNRDDLLDICGLQTSHRERRVRPRNLERPLQMESMGDLNVLETETQRLEAVDGIYLGRADARNHEPHSRLGESSDQRRGVGINDRELGDLETEA